MNIHRVKGIYDKIRVYQWFNKEYQQQATLNSRNNMIFQADDDIYGTVFSFMVLE